MQEVKIFDFDFNLIASDFKCISFDWEVMYNSIGSFEGVFTLDSPIYDACQNNEFTVCVQGENQGIVTGVRVKGDRIIVSGKSMNYIFEKRICMPFSTYDYGYKMTAAEMACELVQRYCGDFMEVLPAPVLEEKHNYTRNEPRLMSEVIPVILSRENCGHFVKFDTDNKKWVFGCLLPDYTGFVLSRPDNTLEECDYTRSIDNIAVCGVYKQRMEFKGMWDAEKNKPKLTDNKQSNFGKVYQVEKSGRQFEEDFVEKEFILCKTQDGKWIQGSDFEDFWHKIYTGEAEGALGWECILSSESLSDARAALKSKTINENITSIKKGVNQKELKPGDVVEIRLTSGENAVIFTRQIKKVLYHYEWGNCFTKPVFYKVKENEDE